MLGKTRRENRSINWLLVVLVAVAATCAQVALAGNPGSDGMLSLRFPVGTREAGMGDAGVAASSGAAAVFWNPANNVFEDFETALVVQHYRYLGLFNQGRIESDPVAGEPVRSSGNHWCTVDQSLYPKSGYAGKVSYFLTGLG